MDLVIKRKPDGKRYVSVYLGTNKVTGQPMRKSHEFADHLSDDECMAEAQAWYEELLPLAKLGVNANLGEALDRYLSLSSTSQHVPSTINTYRSLRKRVGKLEKAPLKSITTADIELLYEHLLKHGKQDGTGISKSTVRQFHYFLRGAFKELVRLGVLDHNVVADARPPRPDQFEAVAIDEADYKALKAVIKAGLKSKSRLRHATAFAAYISLYTGARCGEVCALTRRDVSFIAGELHIGATITEGNGRPERQSTTKSKQSRNVAVTEDVLKAIRKQIAWQDENIAGANSRTTLVSYNRTLIRPSAISREFSAMAHDAGLPKEVTFHSLRHTHATWLIQKGMDAKTVSERLGHADVAITLRIYSHVMPGRDRHAAEVFSDITGGSDES